jgi:hypothetical protein
VHQAPGSPGLFLRLVVVVCRPHLGEDRRRESPAGLNELQALVRHKVGLETATDKQWTVPDELYLDAGLIT